MTPPVFALRIDKFDYMHGIITLPNEAVWYRAYEKDSVLKNVPTFFGDMEVAHFYANQNEKRKLGQFSCKRSLYVMDVRYVMSFLPFFLNMDFTDKDLLQKITVALGLCSFQKQIELLENLNVKGIGIDRMKRFSESNAFPIWANPLELRGVRVGITDIDYEVMSWLKCLLGKCVDGIIAPAMPSPFHNQGCVEVEKSVLYEELILFSPRDVLSHCRDVPKTKKVEYVEHTGAFDQFLNHHTNIHFGKKLIRFSKDQAHMIAVSGGGDESLEDTKYLSSSKLIELEKEISKKKKEWMKDIRKIHKSQPFLKHTTIYFVLDDYCRGQTKVK
jgi:hypothetical protein